MSEKRRNQYRNLQAVQRALSNPKGVGLIVIKVSDNTLDSTGKHFL
jgi:hypothetical protein